MEAAEEYKCKACNYKTSDKSNFIKHTQTDKHQRAINDKEDVTPKRQAKKYTLYCQYCNVKVSYKHHLSRHYKVCKVKERYDKEQIKDDIIKKLIDDKKEIAKQKEEIAKQNQMLTDSKKELEADYLEYVKSVNADYMEIAKQSISNQSGPTHNQTVNIAGDVNINIAFVRKNFNNVENYIDIMSKELNEDEIKLILSMEPTQGCYKLIHNRCVKNVAAENRSIHCTDLARNKYLIRADNTWDVDYGGNKILQPPSRMVQQVYDTNSVKTNQPIIAKVQDIKKLHELHKNGHKSLKTYLGNQILLSNNKIENKAENDTDKKINKSINLIDSDEDSDVESGSESDLPEDEYEDVPSHLLIK